MRDVVRACYAHGVPVVARGAGTGLSGGANAIDGCVVLALDRMNQIVEIDPLERLAVVQPGVVNDDLRAAVAEHGLWYPPDPASSPWSTIGGNVATNAGGLCCVKYGVTRDYVLALEVVTGTGELVRLGRRTAKGVAGYDLTPLARRVGGHARHRHRGHRAAAPAATAGDHRGRLLLLDRGRRERRPGDGGGRADAVRARARRPALPAGGRRVEEHGPVRGGGGRAARPHRRAGRPPARPRPSGWSAASRRPARPGRRGRPTRRRRTPCSRPAGSPTRRWNGSARSSPRTSACRRRRCPRCSRASSGSPNGTRITIANLAHAGDGNLHPLLITDAGDEDARARAQAAFEDILADALALGGTVTGEHGVGLLKRPGLAAELGPAVLAMHRAIKDALDPKGILNPGKAW